MGGLVLGLCLKKYAPDVHFDIYESASELTEVGAGIGMTHRIWSIMEELGIQDEVVAITGTRDRNGTSPDLFGMSPPTQRVRCCRFPSELPQS